MTDRPDLAGAPSSVGRRVAWLLERSHITEDDLIEGLGLPDYVTVTDVFSGQYILSLSELVAVADLLDVPVRLLTGKIPIDRHLGVSLRLGSVVSDAPTEALRIAEIALEHKALLDSWLGPIPSRLSEFVSTGSYYQRAGGESASRIRDALGIDDEPLGDLVGLIERQGYPVYFLPLPENVAGLNVRDEREGFPSRVIIVSTLGPWTRQRYTLAHELCHALYDDDGQVIVDELEVPDRFPEIRAESFARHLLLPSRPLREDVDKYRKRGTPWPVVVARLMVRWGISRRALLKTLVSEGLAAEDSVAPVGGISVEVLMREAGLIEQWRELSADQHESCGSPMLVGRSVEAYGNGWVSSRVVADLTMRNQAETERDLAEKGWSSHGASGELSS